ncbi:MAG: hypothetical protein DRI89_01715 [Bacteroidetes bacterium]|nr:MAG: hypothetical protein DRI89_01715 [Bacteroidota bacterium]
MRTSLKQYIGQEFVEMSGIKPFVNQLIFLERIPALKVLAILRLLLYETYLSDQHKTFKSKSEINNELRFEVIKEVNERTIGQFGHTSIIVKNEDEFEKILATITNTSLLFLAQSPQMDKQTKQKFFSEYPKIINEFDLAISSPDDDPSIFNRIKKMSQYLSTQLKDKKEEKVMKNKGLKKKAQKASPDEKFIETKPSLIVPEKVPEKQAEHLLTWKETMELLRVSTSTLRRWEQQGSIPKSIHIGGRVFFSKPDIIEQIEKSKQTQKTQRVINK